MRRLWGGLFLFLTTGSLFAADSLYLELNSRGERTRLGLAEIIPHRPGGTTPTVLFSTLKKDLEFTQSFAVVEGGPAGDGRKTKMDGWDRLGAQVVATGRLTETAFLGTLWDVSTGRVLLTKTHPLAEEGRRTAHLWADDIVAFFSGQAGVAASRIVFANDATGKKEICRVDYDGSNFRRLTNDRSIALFPKLSPDGAWIVFTSFRSGRPEIHVMRADGTERRVLCRYEGLNSATTWMPDGKSLIATLSMGREPNLYVVDLEGRVVRALTNSFAADTSPTVSPDGLRLAFTSDRTGPPQIYTMDTSGANGRRVTFSGQCDSPHWSPLGHQVAFTMSVSKNFDIHTLDIATGRATRLTFGEGDNENASWSPDGRQLVFTSSRRGRPELWVMGADGSNPKLLGPVAGRSFSPDWGR